jgi:hypothetical protein
MIGQYMRSQYSSKALLTGLRWSPGGEPFRYLLPGWIQLSGISQCNSHSQLGQMPVGSSACRG